MLVLGANILICASYSCCVAGNYSTFEAIARERMESRDPDDWPVLASALALGCPIWTEGTDFFDCGVATWTTDRIELYLATSADREV